MGLLDSFLGNNEVNELKQKLILINGKLMKLMVFVENTPSQTIPPVMLNELKMLYEKIYDLYFPREKQLTHIMMTMPTTVWPMPIGYWMTAFFNIGLNLETEFNCKIFSSENQRSFGKI